MNIRFLTANEYADTASLFTECFGFDGEFMEEFYGSRNADGCVSGVIKDGIIAAACDGSEHRAMVQVIYKTAVPVSCDSEAAAGSRTIEISGYKVPYIMGVCTLPEYRHRGLMDRLMNLVIDKLKADGYPWCFLIAVDKNIYRHLGFSYDWKLSDRECELLYADDGLDTASGRLLNADHIENVRIV